MIILQHYSGDDSLLPISNDLHVQYCKRHNAKFITCNERLCNLEPQWDKLMMLLCCSKAEGKDHELLVFLDHDCLIVGDEEFDLHPLMDFGLVLNIWNSYNTGVIVMRNSSKSKDFLQYCLDLGNVIDQQVVEHEQARFNRDYKKMGMNVETLNSRWNYYQTTYPTLPIQVRAWHGVNKSHAACEMGGLANGLLRSRCQTSNRSCGSTSI
jgi:hypothetical protein